MTHSGRSRDFAVHYSSRPNVIGHLNYQIQNGKRVLLWPEHVAEGKFIPMPR